jgi:hypothetical protein
VVSCTPRPIYYRGKSLFYTLDRRLGGPQSRSRRFLTTGTRTPIPRLSNPYPVAIPAAISRLLQIPCLKHDLFHAVSAERFAFCVEYFHGTLQVAWSVERSHNSLPFSLKYPSTKEMKYMRRKKRVSKHCVWILTSEGLRKNGTATFVRLYCAHRRNIIHMQHCKSRVLQHSHPPFLWKRRNMFILNQCSSTGSNKVT